VVAGLPVGLRNSVMAIFRHPAPPCERKHVVIRSEPPWRVGQRGAMMAAYICRRRNLMLSAANLVRRILCDVNQCYRLPSNTGVPRPIPSVFDAFPLFTAISTYPLDPIYATGSPGFPLANIITMRVTE
jgi:hypothetical protein